MQNQSLFSDLKLRLSYGKVGNQAVAPYQSLSRLGVAWYSSGATEIPALAPGGGMPNPDLKWEEKTELNVGFDASLLSDRVTLSLDAYDAKTTGLWQEGDQCYLKNPAQDCVPGEYKIADTNGDSAITAADRVILGYGDPEFYGGLSNTLTYGRFSLDVFLSFNYGNKIINAGNAYGGLAIGQANERATVLDRWTPTHTNTDVPRADAGRPRRLYSTLGEDGSNWRLHP